VDGDDHEWQYANRYYDENTRTTIRAFNDEQFLYLCMASSDRGIQRQIRRGLTLWFGPNGSKGESFGIRFPLGQTNPDDSEGKERSPMLSREKNKKNMMPQDEIPEIKQEYIEIIQSGDTETQLASEIKALGISARLGRLEGRLIYELKVPLYQAETFPYAIGMKNAGTVGIKFVTEKMDMEEMRKRRGGRGKMGGMGGPGSMGRPDGMGRGGGMKSPGGKGGSGKKGRRPGGNMIQPMELWMEVQLAQRIRYQSTKMI
jgi:hypothetical protein